MTAKAPEDFLEISRHVSVWVDVPPQVAYGFAADPASWPRWAAGLAEGELRQTSEGWVADSPMGRVLVEFSPDNGFGVLDHVVTLPTGEQVYNPLRVVPSGPGESRCELIFTVRKRPSMSDDEFERDSAAVLRDLTTLRGLLQR